MIKLIIIIAVVVLLFGLYKGHPYRIIDKEKSDNYYYTFFKTAVHYVPMGNWFELGNQKMEAVDIKTVRIPGSNYLKDKTVVYFKSTKIKNADPASFEILCSNHGSFARDKNMIYFGSNSFKDLDIGSFGFAGTDCSPVLKDKDHVYSIYSGEYDLSENVVIPPIQNCSAEKYQFLNDFYGKDDLNVYYKGRPIAGAEAKSFILLADYAKDNSHVYFHGLPVEDIDPASFMLVDGGGYTKDRNGVYFGLNAVDDPDGHPIQYKGRIVEGADPETFTMIKGEKIDYAKDKTRHYWGGKEYHF